MGSEYLKELTMKAFNKYLIITIFTLCGLSGFVAAQEHDHAHDSHNKAEHMQKHQDENIDELEHGKDEVHEHEEAEGDEHENENKTRISKEMANKVGIETAVATQKVLRQTITSYGTLSTGAEQLSHMRARFSGLITAVNASIGDMVRRGDLLAEVESNESLKTYKVKAPISGTVVQRHANTGEVTKDQVLFSIANFDTLWAEFRIYPAQREKVSAGKRVEITSGDRLIEGEISHIIPALDKPYQLARVKIDNRQLGLSPGLLVEGRVVFGDLAVPLAIEKGGIQNVGSQAGVFIQEGDSYQFTPLRLGRSDDRYVEVLGGLQNGQRYVNRNSYLIKADIEKSEAEHDH